MSNVEHIYIQADYLGIDVVPYQRKYIDNTAEHHIIPVEYITKLSVEDMNKYIHALQNVHSYEAGGLFGWATAHEKLAELGFEEHTVRQGHRAFVSMEFNPEKFEVDK